MKLLTYDETKKFRPPSCIDNLTLWTREERYIINIKMGEIGQVLRVVNGKFEWVNTEETKDVV